MAEQLYFRQLKAGRDFGRNNPVCVGMDNFIYLIGDRVAGQCVVVDPAWDVGSIVSAANTDGMQITGAMVTHWHPDHVGGPLMNHKVEGLPKLLELSPCKVHVHRADVQFVKMMTGISDGDITAHDSGDRVAAGAVEVECLHTPGHTAGSMCFRCGNALIAGDTLFLQGCGRLDLPGGNVEEMWTTLTERLATLPGDLRLYPGHDYSGASAPLEEVRRTNAILQAPDMATWRRMMGR